MQKTWGPSFLSHVAMVTTMWDLVELNIGTAREEELKTNFWHKLLENGSFLARYGNTRDSALSIIDKFMLEGRGILEIQHELVDLLKVLKDTAAGQELEAELVKQRLKFERELENLKGEFEDYKLDLEDLNEKPSSTDQKEFSRKAKDLNVRIGRTDTDVAALNVDALQLLEARDREMQIELDKLQRQYDLDSAQIKTSADNVRSLRGRKGNLQKAFGTGTTMASTAATACVVM